MNAIVEANYWLERAEETRTLAETFTDEVARETMLSIAAGYEDTAKQLVADRVAPARRKSLARGPV